MEKEVAYKPNTIAHESLPFPFVLYPGHYGAFFAFKKNKKSEPHFCACSYEAISNYIKIRKSSEISLNVYADRMYILDSLAFPKSVVQDLMSKNVSDNDVLKSLKFSEKLCHECNLQTPTYRYCVEMYGGAFKQNYGWYSNKQGFEWGFDRHKTKIFLTESCSDELLFLVEDDDFKNSRDRACLLMNEIRLIESDHSEVGDERKKRLSSLIGEKIELDKKLSKHYRKIGNVIENEVRNKFGHKKIGEAWTSETILYYIVKKLFPQFNVIRHFRPKLLEGLELDIYIEEIGIGIEYQGIQHYKPVKHWGGKEALLKVQARDKKKKEICGNNDIPLIYFEHNEGLTNEFVLQKLEKYINRKS